MPQKIENASVGLERPGRFLWTAPASPGPDSILVLSLHGHAMTPETMLALTGTLLGDKCVIAAPEAPNFLFHPNQPPYKEVAYSWGAPQTAEFHVGVHHQFVLGLLEYFRARFGLDGGRALLMGFSQSVGLNYRFAATHPGAVRAVLGLCGGVPGDWENGGYKAVSAAVMHIAREEDEFYPAPVALKFEQRLRAQVEDLEFHMLPGGHRFPSKAGHIVRPWLERVFTAAS